MNLRNVAGLLVAGLLVTSACTATPGSSPGSSPASSPVATVCDNLPAGSDGDLLATICERGRIVSATDADYAPQSSVTESGQFEGFDIDVGTEVARRLGVTVEWTAQVWDTIAAGNWSGRWDMHVGSMTVTPERDAELFEFTQPYYFTPAVVAAVEGSGITSVEDLAGKVACVGEDTTYLYWIDGTLTLGEGGEIVTQPPEGLTATTLPTDANCAEAVRSGRRDFQAFISAQPTVQEAIDADTPIEIVGDPIFFEPLAIGFDQNGPEAAALVAAVDEIVGQMHADGTLTQFSMKWYDEDLTKTE